MLKETRTKFSNFTTTIATLNNISSVAEKFTVAPSVQQKMEKRVQQSAEFLQKINFEFPIEQQGQKIGVGAGETIAGRTDTTAQERNPSDPISMNANSYFCRQTNYDTVLRYAQLDAWAHRPEFQPLVRDAILQRKALDRILIGFNGKSAAETTDRIKNPLLQDVNIGWLEHIRKNAPERVLSKGEVVENVVSVCEFGDYKNIDALVYDCTQTLIDEVFAESADLVVICHRNTLTDKYFPIINDADTNVEKIAGKMLVSTKLLGGLPAYAVPGFPKDTILITSFKNLSIYIQSGSARRAIIDNPKRDRIENFESNNEAFVVEDYRACCLIENISFEAIAKPDEKQDENVNEEIQNEGEK